jgi:hypothetical protein
VTRPDPPEHFPFAVPDSHGPARLLRLLGLPRPHDGVRFDGVVLDALFGPWHVTTTIDNVASAEVGGPYSPWKALGARLSLADRGLTFGTDPASGVCIAFRKPVRGIEPTGLLRHPGLTVTVAQPALLAARLRAAMDGVHEDGADGA